MDPQTYDTLKGQWEKGGRTGFGTGNNEPESAWTTIARMNPFSRGNAEATANEQRGDDMMNGALQDWRNAGQKLKAGDVDGYMSAYKSYLGKLKDANGYYSAAESGKANMANDAMNQAQQTFNASTEALSALSNPAGYAIGKGVSYGTTKLIDYAAPNMDPTLKKVLVTGASFVGSSYASGVATGLNPNIMKPLVETGLKTDVATTLAQTYVTYHTEGGKAAAVDLLLGAATLGASNVKGKNGKTLGETISGAGQTHGAAIKDNVVAAANAANNTVKQLTGPSEGGQALAQGAEAAFHNPKGDPSAGPTSTGPAPKKDPITGNPEHGSTNKQPPPALDPQTQQQVNQSKPPAFSEPTNKALMGTGNHPEAVKKLQQATDATGVAVAIPSGGDPKLQLGIIQGKYGQKMLGTDSKSVRATGDIPFHPRGGKMGETFVKAKNDYRSAKAEHAKNPTPQTKAALDAATKNVRSARQDIKTGLQQNIKAQKEGRVKVAFDPESNCKVLLDPSGRKIKPDIDVYSTNANARNRGAKTNHYEGMGICTPAEARWHQASSQIQGKNGITNHASDVNSPHGPKPLPNEMVFIVPGKEPQVVKGHDNIVKTMDQHGMDVHPNWRAQGNQAAGARAVKGSSVTAGQTARNASFGPSTDRPTAEQHQLRQTRTESQNQYIREARTAAKTYPGTEGRAAAQRVDGQAGRDYNSNVKRYTQAQRQYTNFDRSAQAANRATGPGEARAMSAYGSSRSSMQASLAQHGARQSRANRAVGSAFSARPGTRRGSLDVPRLLHVALRLPLFTPPGMDVDTPVDDGPTPWRDEEELRMMAAAATALAEEMEALATQDGGQAVPGDDEPIMQSEIHVMVHELSAPAWKADFERRPPFHEGVVEYFTRQVMNDIERTKTPANPSYPAFANEVAVAYRLASVVGEDGLRQAYFVGNMRLMYYRLGQRLGVTGVAEAEAAGRRYLDTASLLMNRGHYEEVQTGFSRNLPPPRAGDTRPPGSPTPSRSGS